MHRFMLIAALALLWAACGTDNPSDKSTSCTADVDCPNGYHCGDDDKCTRQCDVTAAEPACGVGLVCDDRGRCVGDGECVVDDDCDSAPTSASCDGDTAVSFNQIGTCDAGEDGRVCNYTEVRTACETGCVAGACVPDACVGLACDSPPAPTCAPDGTTLVEYSNPGSCDGGVCKYVTAPTSCALGCAGGACLSGTCDGVVCNQAPDDTCDGSTARTFSETGVCLEINGRAVCDYSLAFDDCMYRKSECSNATCGEPITEVGGVVVTEYMANPYASYNDLGEWIEIHNTSGADIDLNGWILRSKGTGANVEEHVFADAPPFPADATLVLAYSSNNVPFTPDYVYDTVRLANNTDWFELLNPAGETVDYVYYEGGAILDGQSRKLSPTAAQTADGNNDFNSWCPELTATYEAFDFGGANYGTPGMPNTPCAADPCADFTCVKPDDYCNTRTNSAVEYVEQSVTCEATRFNNPFCDYDTNTTSCQDGAELCAYGVCETIPANLPAPGELIISEAMPNPNSHDAPREWIEVYNTTDAPLAMFSMIFEDNELDTSNNEYQFLDITLEVPAKGYLVLARNLNPDENGGVVGAKLYAGAHLKNNPNPADDKTPAEGMKLLLTLADGTLIDSAYYDNPVDEDQGFPSGLSLQLDVNSLDAVSNDARGNWCFADPADEYGQGGAGTPGAANRACR